MLIIWAGGGLGLFNIGKLCYNITIYLYLLFLSGCHTVSRTAPLQNTPIGDFATTTRQKSWLLLCLLLAVFVLLSVLVAWAKPASQILVETNNLSVYEQSDLQKLASELGERQFYKANLNEIKDSVLELSWVDSVSVSRDWERGIVVGVRPKKAVANFGSEYLLDANGVPFKPANKAELLNKRLANLHGDPKESALLMQKMQKLNAWFAPLNLVAKDVILTPRHTWVIRFNNGLRVLVDYDRVDEKLYYLSHILADKKNNLDVKKIQVIDLRYKNGFSIAYKKFK